MSAMCGDWGEDGEKEGEEEKGWASEGSVRHHESEEVVEGLDNRALMLRFAGFLGLRHSSNIRLSFLESRSGVEKRTEGGKRMWWEC
jgi:hypothetical protein